MARKVCLLVDWNMYEVLRHFTKKLAEAMQRKGIEVQIIDANRKELDPYAFGKLLNDPPDFTCSFNTFEKVSEDKFLWDVMKIPHIAFLVDPALYFLELTKSPYIHFTSTDRSDAAALKTICPRTFFWPHAVEADLLPGKDSDRIYDVVFFGSCFDYEAWQRHWTETLPASLIPVLEMAIDLVMNNDQITLAEALAQVPHPPEFKDYSLLMFQYLDKYVRGKDRTELIQSIKNARVHVFGEAPSDAIKHTPNWAHYLANQKNVVLHPPVGYEEALNILQQSKICLNSMPFFRDGTHERIFAGLACGALPLTSESRYLRETFVHEQDILYYHPRAGNSVNDLIDHYLAHEPLRRDAAASGRAKTMAAHTWDHRVDTLLEKYSGWLKKLHKLPFMSVTFSRTSFP
jgi:spore maturation protein CgeB